MKITINTYIQLQEELRRLDELFVREEVNEEEYKSRNIEINKIIQNSENYHETEYIEEYEKVYLRELYDLNKKLGIATNETHLKMLKESIQHEKEHAEINEKYGLKNVFCLIVDYTISTIQPMVRPKDAPEITKNWDYLKKASYQVELSTNPKKLSQGDIRSIESLKNIIEFDKKLGRNEKEGLINIINIRLGKKEENENKTYNKNR